MNAEWLNLDAAVAAARLVYAWRVPKDVAASIQERLRESGWKSLKIELLQERITYLESKVPPEEPEPERERTSCKSEWE